MENPHMYAEFKADEYELGRGAPLIYTTSRLIICVVQNQVEILRDILEPRWYDTTDSFGYNLLQLAIRTDNVEVFEYILSLEGFPINFVNKWGKTALSMSIDDLNEHFAIRLLRKGADLRGVTSTGESLLQCALKRPTNHVLQHLLDNGADVNEANPEGVPPLEQVIMSSMKDEDKAEWTATLLCYGADTSMISPDGYNIFELAAFNANLGIIFQYLFLHTYDVTERRLRIFLEVLIKLGRTDTEILTRVMEYNLKYRVCEPKAGTYVMDIVSNDIGLFHDIYNKSPSLIQHLFSCASLNFMHSLNLYSSISINNLETIIQSSGNGKLFLLAYIQDLCYPRKPQLRCFTMDEKTATEAYLYLMSYNVDLFEIDLQTVYYNFGYCELFEILLHMSHLTIDYGVGYKKHAMACLTYDLGLDLNEVLKNHEKYCYENFYNVLYYFAHPRLKELCERIYASDPSILAIAKKSATFASLFEMTRNMIRKYVIRNRGLEAVGQFLDSIRGLNAFEKETLTYQRQIYKFTDAEICK